MPPSPLTRLIIVLPTSVFASTHRLTHQKHSPSIPNFHPSISTLYIVPSLVVLQSPLFESLSTHHSRLLSPHTHASGSPCASRALVAMQLSSVILFAILACLVSADFLDITSCYCTEKFDLSGSLQSHTESGRFYRFEYYNEHLDRTYDLNVTQRFGSTIDGPVKKDTVPKLPESCRLFEDGNELCYYRKNHQIRGRMIFNDWKRKTQFPGIHPEYPLRGIGYDRCRDEYCPRVVGLERMVPDATNHVRFPINPICALEAEGDCPRNTLIWDWAQGTWRRL